MSELVKKRLLQQAGVFALAGLLMSSAVIAEDITDPVADGEIEITSDVEGGDDVGGGDPSEGEVQDGDADLTDPPDPTDPDVMIDPIELEGEVVDDRGCIDCSGIPDDAPSVGDEGPDVTLDPMEMDGAPVADADIDVGIEAQSGGAAPEVSHSMEPGRGRDDNAVPAIRTILN